MKNFYFLLLFLSLISFSTFAQEVKRVLFLGNSYIAANYLPNMISALAISAGDLLEFNSNTPGGYTFQGHSTNATSISLIEQGNWDIVVLQEQSQLPSFPDVQVLSSVFPYAQILDSMIVANNSCAETMFYMTWGRKIGDTGNCPTWPPVCTYEGMDDLLAQRYMQMMNDNDAVVSPVGKVWRYLRTNFPAIELYQADNSHPSLAGTYAAACCFYTSIFEKDPLLITSDQGLSAQDALTIRNAVKTIVYDDFLTYNIGLWDFGPTASFTFNNSNMNSVGFTNTSVNGTEFAWDFGDGSTSIEENPTHIYTTGGTFKVLLSVTNCNITEEYSLTVAVPSVGIHNLNNDETWNLYPNPANDFITIDSKLTNEMVTISNQIGQIVGEYSIGNSSLKITIDNLPKGIYFVKLKNYLGTKMIVKN